MPVWSQKASFKGHGSPCRGSPALFSTGTTWFLQLRDQICVLDSAASLRQWEIFFFPLKQTNLPVSYWSNLIVATQPTHYIFAILRKAFPEQGVGSRAQFYFPLNWDTLEISKAALSVTGKQPCGTLAAVRNHQLGKRGGWEESAGLTSGHRTALSSYQAQFGFLLQPTSWEKQFPED